jgi:acyl dehydratase
MQEPRLFWEDFQPGAVVERTRPPVTKAEIIEFAREFDPQPFHLDEIAGAASLLGGLCASGWHTCAMMMRLMCDAYILDSAALGAPGIEETRWIKPVLVGDILTVKRTCLETRASSSRPTMGLAHFTWEAVNQRGETVALIRFWSMFRRRFPAPTAEA